VQGSLLFPDVNVAVSFVNIGEDADADAVGKELLAVTFVSAPISFRVRLRLRALRDA
jgi:hypothetical protein